MNRDYMGKFPQVAHRLRSRGQRALPVGLRVTVQIIEHILSTQAEMPSGPVAFDTAKFAKCRLTIAARPPCPRRLQLASCSLQATIIFTAILSPDHCGFQ